MYSTIPLFGPVGPEVLIILLLIVLLFGANRIPRLARSTGEAIGEFRRGRKEETAVETGEADSKRTESTDSKQTDSETARAN